MPRRQPVRVLCIGDSITSGIIAGGGVCYVSHLSSLLGWQYEVINAGAGGTSVLDWTRPPVFDLPAPIAGAYELLAGFHMPCDVAVVELGGNDAAGFFEATPTPVLDYRSKMLDLVARLKQDGARRVLVLTPAPIPCAEVSVRARLLSYRITLLGVKWPRGVSVLDVAIMLSKSDYEDGNVHPSESGHKKIAEAVAKSVRRISRGPLRRLLSWAW